MNLRIKLSKTQWKLLASVFSNIGQAVILFSAASFFVPETVNLSTEFSKINALIFFNSGLILISIGVILRGRGE